MFEARNQQQSWINSPQQDNTVHLISKQKKTYKYHHEKKYYQQFQTSEVKKIAE